MLCLNTHILPKTSKGSLRALERVRILVIHIHNRKLDLRLVGVTGGPSEGVAKLLDVYFEAPSAFGVHLRQWADADRTMENMSWTSRSLNYF